MFKKLYKSVIAVIAAVALFNVVFNPQDPALTGYFLIGLMSFIGGAIAYNSERIAFSLAGIALVVVLFLTTSAMAGSHDDTVNMFVIYVAVIGVMAKPTLTLIEALNNLFSKKTEEKTHEPEE